MNGEDGVGGAANKGRMSGLLNVESKHHASESQAPLWFEHGFVDQ
jgi:hypothetical protein